VPIAVPPDNWASHLDTLQQLSERPGPFAPGASQFWDDPHISASMLAAHLDETRDAASRRPDMIDASVTWLLSALDLHPGAMLLDLGCGPGLYSERFSRAGLRVTGIDLSRRSIDYASARATEQQLAIDYRRGDYLALDDRDTFDVVTLIYGDLCVIAPAARDRLLGKIYAALKSGGRFAFDVTTPHRHASTAMLNRWQVHHAGFWRPTPHLVLTRGFAYPDRDLFLEQYVIIDADGTLTTYRNWFQDYTVETITAVLRRHGFTVEGIWGDLSGQEYRPDSEWIGVIVRKR
jgi:2-polyprenyl-3-methyl-5-hydroxy-6-metoxy-1,4-benzoquinol methylase